MKLNWVSDNTGPLSLPKESFCSMSVLIGQTLDNNEICIPLGTDKTRWSRNGLAPINHRTTPEKSLKANILLTTSLFCVRRQAQQLKTLVQDGKA